MTVHPWERRREAVASESWLPMVATFAVELGTAWVSASTHTRSGSEPVMVRSPSSMWTSAPESWSRTPEKAMTSRLQCRSVVSTAVLCPRWGTERAPVTGGAEAEGVAEADGVSAPAGLPEDSGVSPGDGGDAGSASTTVLAEEALTRACRSVASTFLSAAVTSTRPSVCSAAFQAARRLVSALA